MIHLCEKEICTGCGACHNICPRHAIVMQSDEEGFVYPQINNEFCVSCGLCQSVCPELNPIQKHDFVTHPLAVVAKSEEVAKKSSSGGMFTVLASWVLEHNGFVFGASFDDNLRVTHIKISSISDLDKLRGSKYVQSNILYTYKEVRECLKNKSYVLFSGTPCQIAGLYGFLGKLDITLLFTVDIVCHGVPSIKAFHLYLEKLSLKEHFDLSEIRSFLFRDLHRWNVTPSMQIEGYGKRILSVDKNIYMLLFLSSRLHRYSCYHCQYACQRRISDITIADFWGIGEKVPFKYDVSHGCSLVLVNSVKGESLFKYISGKINFEERQWEEALNDNSQLHSCSVCPKDRKDVYKYMESHTYEKIFNHYFNTPIVRLRRFVGKIIDFLHLRWILIKILN